MTLDGGWKVEFPVSEKNKKVFETAIEGHVGVDYEPIAAATQVINGVNYIFIAKATNATVNEKVGMAKIRIEETPDGTKPRLVDIKQLIP